MDDGSGEIDLMHVRLQTENQVWIVRQDVRVGIRKKQRFPVYVITTHRQPLHLLTRLVDQNFLHWLRLIF